MLVTRNTPRTVPDLWEVHYYVEFDIPNPFAGEFKP